MVIVGIEQNHIRKNKRSFTTQNLNLKVGNNDLQLFDLMHQMKIKLSCKFEFKFNSERMEIAMACILPSGYILAIFLIAKSSLAEKDAPYIVHQVFASQA